MRLTLKSLFILAALLVAWHGAKAIAEELVLDEFEELQGWTAIGLPGKCWGSFLTPNYALYI